MHGNDAFSKKVYSRDFVWLSSWASYNLEALE
jgi:hypothetical protein